MHFVGFSAFSKTDIWIKHILFLVGPKALFPLKIQWYMNSVSSRAGLVFWNKNHDYSFIFSITAPVYLASILGNPCSLFRVNNLPASRLENDGERKVDFFIPSPRFETGTYKTARWHATNSSTLTLLLSKYFAKNYCFEIFASRSCINDCLDRQNWIWLITIRRD